MSEFHDMMLILSQLNAIDPAGYNATLSELEALQGDIRSIVEIGFGRGDFSIMLAEKYPNAVVTGFDAHELSVQTARMNLKSKYSTDKMPSNINFEHVPVKDMIRHDDNSFDVITTTFVNHHIFPDEEFVNFLKYVRRVGRKAFIFNDLQRSFSCYMGVAFGATVIRLFGTNYLKSLVGLVQLAAPQNKYLDTAYRYLSVFDNSRPGNELALDGGILSVARSFTNKELVDMFQRAGYHENALKCHSIATHCRVVCTADLEM